MKRVSLTCSIIFALAAIVLGTAAGTARAAVILLDVSGSILSTSEREGNEAFCGDLISSPTPCALGGSIIINNSTNVVLSADVLVGASTDSVDYPQILEFKQFSAPSAQGGLTRLRLVLPASGKVGLLLDLLFSAPTAGSLVGYTGGPLSNETMMSGPSDVYSATLVSGSLTEGTGASFVPEPSARAMMLLGFAGLGFLGYRRTWGAKLQAA
jgi:hypothetical protein